MQYLIILILSIGNFALYAMNVRLFLMSILIVYPIVGQMTSINFNIFGATINISMAYGSLIFAICLIEMVRLILVQGKEKFDALIILSILFLMACVISIIFSVNKYNSIVSTVKVSTWVFLIIIARRNFGQVSDLIWIGRITIISSMLIVISYILSKYGFYGTYSTGYEQYGVVVPIGYFYNQVSFAYPLAMSIPIIMVILFLKPKKLIPIIQIVVNVSIILLSYVRAAFLVLIIGYLGLTYYLSRFRMRRASVYMIIGVIVFVSIFAVFQYLQPDTATNRWMELNEQFNRGNYERLGSGRVGLIINALDFQMNKQSLYGHIFGLGLGNSGSINKYKKIVHNSILEVWLGCGIIGLLLYAMLLLQIWKDLKLTVKTATNDNVKILGCLGIMNFIIFLSANFDVILFAVFPMSIFAIHVGATMGLIRGEYQV